MAEKLTKRTVDRLIAEADADRDTLVWDAAVPLGLAAVELLTAAAVGVDVARGDAGGYSVAEERRDDDLGAPEPR